MELDLYMLASVSTKKPVNLVPNMKVNGVVSKKSG